MGHIRVLSDPLIDRIAAGEVVERPASVVKELVENSLDAGARSIDVQLVQGGKQRIRVLDDGQGMDRDDALLAVERHATSKLSHADDLLTIATLGFRGEALSSIAAVSRLTLSTALAAGVGTEIEIHAGRIQSVREIGLPAGTTIQVDRLFYNVPARRKFLRADSTELSHAVRWITRYALALPDRRFRLRHGERSLLDLAATGDLLQRIAQIHGGEFAEKLSPFEARGENARVWGLAGRPVDALPRRDAQHLIVNGRAVQDRILNHAVSQAYENTIPRGRFPALFLFLEVDPDAVDVNVHPQKTEVRFRESSRIHDLVRGALIAALTGRRVVPSLGELRPASLPQEAVREAALRYVSSDPGFTPRPNSGEAHIGRAASALAQYRESYIVAQDLEGLVLVDQHAAHERVLYELYLAEAESNEVEVQRMLFPVTLELTPQELVALEQELAEFRRLGFRVEPFGGKSVRLEGVPAVAAGVDAESLFRELLGQTVTTKTAAADNAELRHRLVTSASCQAAIKVNHGLTLTAMQRLVDDLYATDNPTTCPHGRPVLFRLTHEELERAFRRR